MSPTMKDLGIDRLDHAQRMALVYEIWESLENDPPRSPLTPEHRAELFRRRDEMIADPSIALTWEEIRASVESGS